MNEPVRVPQVLVVEDEDHIAAGLKINFELEGYAVSVAATARDAEALFAQQKFDMIILDVMLPDINGFALCRRLRESGDFTPVIMLTARNAPGDRITGLDVGADDYLAKPFELTELLARVRSVLRRQRWQKRGAASPQWRSFANVRVNFATHDVFVGETAVKLTQLELDLLRYFLDNPNRVLGREELLDKVWKLGNYPNTRTVDNFILRLRKLFEPDPTLPRHFLSVRGSGYKFTL